MTDPERISKRSMGLAAELLRAGVEEQPSGPGMDRTLAALGISGAVITSSAAAHAAISSAKLGGAAAGGASGAAALKATSTALLVKWIGIGVVGGVGLAGVASVASSPSAPVASATATPRRAVEPPRVVEPPVALPVAAPPIAEVEAPPAPSVKARESVRDEAQLEPVEVGAPLAAEVAFIDQARELLASGRTEQGLAQLARYEREFPEARLLPEALFLRLEACERTGRHVEARALAEQLLRGFPKSPHAARARKLLGP
jgi:hypothetical protein